jgi:hypothetical protein
MQQIRRSSPPRRAANLYHADLCSHPFANPSQSMRLSSTGVAQTQLASRPILSFVMVPLCLFPMRRILSMRLALPFPDRVGAFANALLAVERRVG